MVYTSEIPCSVPDYIQRTFVCNKGSAFRKPYHENFHILKIRSFIYQKPCTKKHRHLPLLYLLVYSIYFTNTKIYKSNYKQ